VGTVSGFAAAMPPLWYGLMPTDMTIARGDGDGFFATVAAAAADAAAPLVKLTGFASTPATLWYVPSSSDSRGGDDRP
jgi:hypothetical protein